VVNALVGGWRLAGITTFHSGLPVPFQAGGTNYLSQYFGAGPIRPNVVPGCEKHVGGSQQSRAARWFNTSCYTQPGPFSFGNESRVDGQVRAAGAANFDLSAGKIFKVYEQVTGKFSVESFNLFNRAQFGPPNANVAAGSAFGTVTAQANLPRVLQFALRFTY
jgi:hypothetical protein